MSLAWFESDPLGGTVYWSRDEGRESREVSTHAVLHLTASSARK